MEVVGITGFSHLATAKVLGIQNQRLAQCRFAKINFLGPDKVAVQVDGEAWLQEPGTIVVSHKNKARMLFKSKVYDVAVLGGVTVCVVGCGVVFAPARMNLTSRRIIQYTQKSHFICTVRVDIGHLWTPKHPLEQTVVWRVRD